VPILTPRKAVIGVALVGLSVVCAYWYIERRFRQPYEEMQKRQATVIENSPPAKSIEEKMEEARARLKRG